MSNGGCIGVLFRFGVMIDVLYVLCITSRWRNILHAVSNSERSVGRSERNT